MLCWTISNVAKFIFKIKEIIIHPIHPSIANNQNTNLNSVNATEHCIFLAPSGQWFCHHIANLLGSKLVGGEPRKKKPCKMQIIKENMNANNTNYGTQRKNEAIFTSVCPIVLTTMLALCCFYTNVQNSFSIQSVMLILYIAYAVKSIIIIHVMTLSVCLSKVLVFLNVFSICIKIKQVDIQSYLSIYVKII